MRTTRLLVATTLVVGFATLAMGASETKEQLTKKLWPRERVLSVLVDGWRSRSYQCKIGA